MTINEVTDRVIISVDNSWSTLEKIRYVYLAVGKMLSKYTDFFFSVDNKLAEQQLSMSEIEEVYEDDKSSGDLRVICRSAAYILERIYSELGIKSELIKSNNNVINYEVDDKSLLINHWFLAVYDDDGKAYFLTLASDLPYIQTNMQTRHFATNIPYRKMAKNGDIIQVYSGDEIEHTVLSDAELRELDMKVGYIKHKYNYDENYYKQYKTDITEQDAIYIIKATAPINSEAHANAQTQLSSGKVKMLIDERVAKTKLLGTKIGQNMKPEERADYLKPFTLTSILKEEMMNLREENEGVNIILKQANKGVRKDKFSAFEYGLYYIKEEEDRKKKKKKFNAKDWLFMN